MMTRFHIAVAAMIALLGSFIQAEAATRSCTADERARADARLANIFQTCSGPLKQLLAEMTPQEAHETVPNIEELLKEAESALALGNEEAAKSLFQKVADLGSGEAHYALAYKFAHSAEERAYHFSEAAKQGIQEALDPALDSLFFQAENLKIANPRKALGVYELAVKANPALSSWRNIDVIRMCIEPGEFDGNIFMDTYGIEEDQSGYSVWELAEEAANGGRFGEPNAELVLHLVCRGGVVPFETELAVSHAYNQWRNHETPRFDLCNFVSSRFGLNYCSGRRDRVIEERLSQLSYPAVKNRIWIVNGINILPTCLETVWASGDNYEEYERQFPEAKEFYERPGRYWGGVVPTSALHASWGDKISIPKAVEECNVLEDGERIEIENNHVDVIYPDGTLNSYRLLAQWSPKECETVVPGFAGRCHSLVFVWIDNSQAIYGKFYNTYAYITDNGVDYVVPATNNVAMDDFLAILNEK